MSDVQTEERPADGTAPVTETEETVVADATGDEATGGHAVDEAVGAEGAIEDAPAEAPVASETPAGPGPLEGLRAAVIAGCERLNQACQGADADFIRGQLEDLRARVGAVRPTELTPRTGLGGLFDSRKKRVARFRDHVTDLAPSISTAAVKLRDAAAELARRNGGLKHLPLTRMIQNVDARLAETAGQAAEAAMGWRDDLLRALGADGKKLAPLRRVHPDQSALNQACEALLSVIDRAEAAVTAARARRDEVMARLDRTLAAARGEETA